VTAVKNKQTKQGIGRRTFLKTMGIAALGIGGSMFPAGRHLVRPAAAQEPGTFESCRIVVFGSDSLRIDYAQTLHDLGAPALSALNPPICATCGGLSYTQPGWASIWSGMPSQRIKCWSNGIYERMPWRYHIVEKLCAAYLNRDLFTVWLTGKGGNIKGRWPMESPHRSVFKSIALDGDPGVYLGDEDRTNSDVYQRATKALSVATKKPNFLCFVHFSDPDKTGHLTKDYDTYMEKAWEVDNYIAELMDILPPATDVIYCSDHGFDFTSLGDTNTGHKCSPHGMLATNFETVPKQSVSQMAIGRLIYKRAGGNPNWTLNNIGKSYKMFGEDLV
jgi:hypothetical protein